MKAYTTGKARLRRVGLVLALVGLTGCATHTMRGYQNTFQGYSVPDTLLQSIRARFKAERIHGALIERDNVGRVRLAGQYENEDEVDQAFTIVQTLVGLKATSPFYPQNIRQRRWEAAASQALQKYVNTVRQGQNVQPQAPGVRRALVIGVNTFLDPLLTPVQGEDDARAVADQLSRYGYRVTALFGKAATKAAIEGAIASLRAELQPADALFLYVSSHGAPPLPSAQGGDERRMSIVAYDTGFPPGQQPSDAVAHALQIQRTAVKDVLLQDLARQATQTTRVLVDTCYSGEMLRGLPSESREFILRQNGGVVDRAGISLASWSGERLNTKGIRLSGGTEAGRPGDASVRGSPAAPAARGGYTLITATSEGELAYGPDPRTGRFTSPVTKDRELQGSFFTQSLLAWLDLHNGKLQPAFDAASKFTSGTVLSHGLKQTPRMASSLSAADDDLTRY